MPVTPKTVLSHAEVQSNLGKLPAQADQIEDALDYVKKAAPDAMKHFGIGPADIREKLRAKIGVLAAGALPSGKI